MSVPFNQQRLQRDFVATIKTEQASGKAVSGADLLCAVEQRMGPLPEALRELFSAFSIPAVGRPGRPAGNSAREDFGLRDLDKRYTTLLRQLQSEDRNRSTRETTSPSERAYRQLAAGNERRFRQYRLAVLEKQALRLEDRSFSPGGKTPSIQRISTRKLNGSFPLINNQCDFP